MTLRLDRYLREDLKLYLEHARSHYLDAPSWGPRRRNCHGEGRSMSQETWHIGAQRQSRDGHHITCIVHGDDGGPEVQDTRIDWGTTRPDLIHVLNKYKRIFGVRVNTPTPHNSDDDDNDRRGGGGSGAGGKGRGKYWSKKVKRDDYGGCYYFNERGEYVECDSAGNDIGQKYASGSSYSYAGGSSYLSHSSSRSRYRAGDDYAGDYGYSTSRGRGHHSSSSSSSTKYYRDSAGRLYYVDRHGETQWA